MSNFKIIQLEQGTSEWLAYRRNGLGASEYPAIIGTSGAHNNREDIIQSKLNANTKQLSEFVKKKFELGHLIESNIREDQNRIGYNFLPVVCESLSNPRMFASLDGYDEKNKLILEVKSTTSKSILDQITQGIVPDIYTLQIQYQLFVTGLPKAQLIVVNADNRERYTFEVFPDSGHFSMIASAVSNFFEELDARKKTCSLIEHDEDALKLEEIVKKLNELKAATKILEDSKDYIADKLLRTYNAYVLNSSRITIEYCERQGNVDYKSIPELKEIDLEKYRKKSSSYIKVSLAKGSQK